MNLLSLVENLKKHKILSPLFDHETLTKLIRYLLIGFTAFTIEYASFALLFKYMGLSDVISNTMAMTAGFIWSFVLNRVWSFKSTGNLLKQLLQFSLLFIINLQISNITISVLSSSYGVSPLISKIIIMVAIVTWNFILYKKVIYRC